MAVVDAVIADRATEAVRVVAETAPVRAAFLFGSHVEGQAHQWSDVDVAVFVEGAEHWTWDRRWDVCRPVHRQVGWDIELHVFPATWYERPPRSSFAQYIIKHGVPLEIDGTRTHAV